MIPHVWDPDPVVYIKYTWIPTEPSCFHVHMSTPRSLQIKRDPSGGSEFPAIGVVGHPVVGTAALLQQLQRTEDTVRALTEENAQLKAARNRMELWITQKVPSHAAVRFLCL